MIFNSFREAALKNLNKIAVIEPNMAITYSDILRLHSYFENELLKTVKGTGKKIAFFSTRYEFYLVMILTASRYSHRVYFVQPDQLPDMSVEFDWYVSEQPVPKAPKSKYIQIRPNWFQGALARPLKSPEPAQNEAVYAFNTSGYAGSRKLCR